MRAYERLWVMDLTQGKHLSHSFPLQRNFFPNDYPIFRALEQG